MIQIMSATGKDKVVHGEITDNPHVATGQSPMSVDQNVSQEGLSNPTIFKASCAQ